MTHKTEDTDYNRLKGDYKHYCLSWDGLPIDEHCVEFCACDCFGDTIPDVRLYKELQWHKLYSSIRLFPKREDNG